MAMLKAETGYNVQTISQALRDLCVLTIDSHRVLLAVQDRAASGTFATNRYLLFPSDEDVARYAGEEGDPQACPPLDVPRTAAPQAVQPSVEKPSTVQPDTARPSTEKAHEKRTMGNKNQGEQEPGRERARRQAHPAVHESSAGLPPSAQHPAIANAVTDLVRWTRVLDDWQANAWRAESVGKMLDRYHHDDQEYSHAPPSDRRAPADGRAGRPSAAPTPEELARFLNRLRPGRGQPTV